MDSITQIILGAAVGEAVGGKKMGNKAALWGAIAGTIPDLDVLFNAFYTPIEASLMHRGFSHSLFFAFLSAPFFAWACHEIYKKQNEYRTWLFLFFFGIVTHPLLDVFTSYGTGLLWPSPQRLAIDSVFVVDPLYTIPFLITLLIALFLKRTNKFRSIINWIGIIYSSLYLLWGVLVQHTIEKETNNYFALSGIKVQRSSVCAMPATTFYWMILGEDQENFYVTYKSIFGEYNPSDLEVIPKNQHVLDSLKWLDGQKNYPDLLKFMSKGWYTLEETETGYNFYNLRFGTATKLTNGKSTVPVFGFGLIIDNGIVNKTIRISNRGALSELNFDAYWNKVFATYEK